MTVTGHVQGLVIGDHNTVHQHYHTSPADLPVPREAPVLYDPVVGRDALLATLGERLTTGDPPRTTALCGMGGIGKSTLAALFAGSDAATHAFPDGCFWIDLRDGDPMDALARVAHAFAHNTDGQRTLSARSRAVRSMLADRRILIVTDDARAEEEVLPFLPAHPDAALLVTTRDESLAAALTDRIVAVDRLDTDAAVALLETLAGAADRGDREYVLRGLVEDLGGLPLALELVGKQARKEARRPGFSWSALRARYSDATQRLGLARNERGVRTAFDQAWNESLSTDGRRHFALLGLFPGAELLTGEVAVAWDEEEDVVRRGLGELLDLSLLRQVDAVTLRLHPLLQDFAAEKRAIISDGEQREAHRRVSDYHFERAPREPVTWHDIQPALSSHLHACAAGDRERARRVFPWFDSVPVPGFLIDRGFLGARIHHLGLDLAFARQEGPIHEAYALFAYASALSETDRVPEAVASLKQALALIASLPDQTAAVVPAARGKFSFRLGQLLAASGDLDGALRCYEAALLDDRATGHDAAALITLQQIGDLWLKRDDPDAEARARAVFSEARDLAKAGGYPAEEAMALTRLADRTKASDPAGTLTLIEAALRLDTPAALAAGLPQGARVPASAFASRQGTRYAIYLGRIAAELLTSLPAALHCAIEAYAIALRRASDADAVAHQAEAVHWLGHLFEHLHMVPGQSQELHAAAACYARSAHIVGTMEVPPAINPLERLETRIFPQMNAADRTALAARIEEQPLAVVQEAIDRTLSRIDNESPGILI